LQLVLRLSSLEIRSRPWRIEAQCVGPMDAALRELDRTAVAAGDVSLTVSSVLVGAVAGTWGDLS
jgi:hypothetical protein